MAGILGFIFMVKDTASLSLEAKEAIDQIKRWWGADRRVKEKLDLLEVKYSRFWDLLTDMEALYRDVKDGCHGKAKRNLKRMILAMKKPVKGATETLVQIKKSREREPGRTRRFRAADREGQLNELLEVITNAIATLEKDVFPVLATLTFVKNNANKNGRGVKQNQARQADRIIDNSNQQRNKQADRLMDDANQRECRVKKHFEDKIREIETPKDKFRSSFAVPRNPDHVRLNYDARRKDGSPGSYEAKVKNFILTNSAAHSSHPLPATTCINGMSGTGKSCAVRGLVRDREIKKRFRGGVYFISLGKDADMSKVASELKQILSLSGGSREAEELNRFREDHESFHAFVETAKRHFDSRDCFFIIDDLRNENGLAEATLRELAQLAQCSANSHVVCTSTSRDISSLGRLVSFKPLRRGGSTAQDVLLHIAGFKESRLSEDARKAMKQVLEKCGGLYVALAIVGNAVRRLTGRENDNDNIRNEAWSNYLNIHRNPGGIILQGKNSGYWPLFDSLGASLRILESNWKGTQGLHIHMPVSQMFRGLCVLRKQQWMSVDIVQELWALKTDKEADLVVRSFEEMSWLNIHDGIIGEFSYSQTCCQTAVFHRKRMALVQLHDLVHEFQCAMANEKKGKKAWHKYLLDRILPHDEDSKRQSMRSWWNCPVVNVKLEGYGRKFDVDYHLKCADLEEERSLLRSAPHWEFEPKLQVTKRYTYLVTEKERVRLPKKKKKKIHVCLAGKPVLQLGETLKCREPTK